MGQRERSAGAFGFVLSLVHVGGLGLTDDISCSVVTSLVKFGWLVVLVLGYFTCIIIGISRHLV